MIKHTITTHDGYDYVRTTRDGVTLAETPVSEIFRDMQALMQAYDMSVVMLIGGELEVFARHGAEAVITPAGIRFLPKTTDNYPNDGC